MIAREMLARALYRAAPAARRLAWVGLLLAPCVAAGATEPVPAGAARQPGALVQNASDPAATAAQGTVDELVASARYWVHHRRDDLAIEQLKKALLVLPEDSDALSGLGQIEVRMGRMTDAARLLARLRAASPTASGTRELDYAYRMAGPDKQKFATVQRLAGGSDPADAIRQLKALFPLGPPTGALAGPYYDTLAQNPPDRPVAIAALQKLVAANPDNTDASLTLASLLNREASTRMQALRIVQRVSRDPYADRSATFNVWRRVLRAAGGDPAYIVPLKTYLAVVPDDTEFRDQLKAAEARLAAQEALAADPYWQARQKGLRLLDETGGVAAAPLLEEALRGRPDDPEVLGGVGVIRMRQGRHMEARALFLRAARLDEDGRGKWESLAQTALFWGTIKQARDAADQGRPAQAEHYARAALAQQPGNESASGLLVDALLAQKKWGQAEPLLRRELARADVTVGTVQQMAELLRNQGRSDEVGALMAALEKRFTGKRLEALERLRARQFADEAERLLAQGKTGPAIRALEASLRHDPGAAWTRYTLARAYSRMGLPQMGRSVMEEGFRRFDRADMSYATALYRDAQNDGAGAQAALDRVPAAQRTDAMRSLDRSLRARRLLADAEARYRRGDRADSEKNLENAAALVPDYPYILASIGNQWIVQGHADRGLALLEGWLRKNASPADPQVDVRLRQGDLLANAGREEALRVWLDDIARNPNLTREQTKRLNDESLRRVLRLTDAAMADDDYDLAERRLYRADPALRADPRWIMELVDLRRSQGRYAQARAALAPLLTRNPDDPDVQLTLARILEQDGDRREALTLVRRVVDQAPPEDVDVRLSAARRFVALRRPREAATVTDALQDRLGARSDIMVEQGKIREALGQYDLAKVDYRRALAQESSEGVTAGPAGTSAQRALDALELRRQPLVEAGVSPSYNSGTAGVSLYRAVEAPMQVRIPQGYLGHWLIHVDGVKLDAGTLDPSDSYARKSLGTFAAQPNGGVGAPLKESLHTKATGVALGAGFEADDWRVDLGTTPVGFPVTNIVGGIRVVFPNDYVGLRLNLSRRAVTGSVLSYAGVRDPVSGEAYGGVVQTGADVRVSRDVGTATAFAQLGGYVYTGRNVQTNQSFKLRTGVIVPVAQARNWRLESGLIGNYWHYSRNLDFYTFGQGGYYSPQRYLSVGVPLRWSGRAGKASWELRGSAGYSNTYESDSPFYPTSPQLQRASGNLVHSGGPGGGFSYSLGGVLQYNLTSRLAVGVSFSIDRSHDNAPSTAMLYFRYLFNPDKGPVKYPPSAVDPYSDF